LRFFFFFFFTMAAISPKPLKVLFHIHDRLDTLDFTAPLEALCHAIYSKTSTPTTRVFEPTVTAVTEHVTSIHSCIFRRHIPIEEAYSRLSEFDVLVIPGGGSPGVLTTNAEPMDLIRAWCALEKEEGRIRTLLSICSASLFLSRAGALKGLTATTHLYQHQRLRDMSKDETTVVDERYVVNKVNDRGMRVITTGGVTCGLDASMWLINEVAGKESAQNVLEMIQYDWRQGIEV
jgi:transcriptional regulator GlxA family with amidase domain